MVYTDQSASQLRLTLATGELDLNQFRTLAKGEMSVGDLRVEARIIGASHVLALRRGSVSIYEVFACMQVQAPVKLVDCGPLELVSGELRLKFPGIAYQFQSRLCGWEQGQSALSLLEQRMDELRSAPQALALRFEFPKAAGDARTPCTLVLVTARVQATVIETVHAYPNEDCIVLTTTTVRR